MIGRSGEDASTDIGGGDEWWTEGLKVRIVANVPSYSFWPLAALSCRMLRDERLPQSKRSIVSEEELAELLNDDE